MAFLGTLYAREGGTVYAMPNAVSLVMNWLVPERGFDSPHRPYAAYGYFMRKIDFSGSPIHKMVDDVVNDEFRAKFGESLDEHLRPFVRQPRMRGKLNAATLAFLLNTEVIHYKVSPQEVDPLLLDEMFLSIPAERMQVLAGAHFKQE